MCSRWHGDLGSPVLWLPPYLCFLNSNSMLPTASDGGRRVGSLYSNWETHRGGGMWSYCWITFKIFVKHLFYAKPSDMGNKSLYLWSSERSKKFEEVRGAFSCARLQWYCQLHAESMRACNDVIGMSAQEHAMMSLAWVHKSLQWCHRHGCTRACNDIIVLNVLSSSSMANPQGRKPHLCFLRT